jgi:hypothetical protein
MCSIHDKGHVTYDLIIDYIKDTILTSTGKYEDIAEHNPLRNKICHGQQTNYGTMEHALKSILCVDLVVKLGEIIENTIQE